MIDGWRERERERERKKEREREFGKSMLATRDDDDGLQHEDEPVLADQQEFSDINSADTRCDLEDLPGVIDDRDG